MEGIIPRLIVIAIGMAAGSANTIAVRLIIMKGGVRNAFETTSDGRWPPAKIMAAIGLVLTVISAIGGYMVLSAIQFGE